MRSQRRMDDTNNNTTSQDRRRKKRITTTTCLNCARVGHSTKQCQLPIISCGIIMFRRDLSKRNNEHFKRAALCKRNEEFFDLEYCPSLSCTSMDSPCELRYLLVRRKDSLNFVEFLRGKYSLNDTKFLYHMFNEMTISERDRLLTTGFSTLWRELWLNSAHSGPSSDFVNSENKFKTLRNGYTTTDGRFISLRSVLQATKSVYPVPEWGFPKGKRNRMESDLDCASREFFEETGCRKEEYEVINQLGFVSETFKGSNRVMYKHIYAVAKCAASDREFKLDRNNTGMIAEIGDIGWFTCKEALRLFRPYDVEKRALIMKLENVLAHYTFPEEAVITI